MNCTRYRWLGLVAGCLALGVPALPAQVSLVTTGAVWRFLDRDAAGSDWTATSFQDKDWASGPAPFGLAGDTTKPAATFLSRTNLAGETNVTFYFRRAFLLPDPAALTNLLVRVRRDDGVVIHLNGQETWRNNMPSGPITSASLASAPAADDGSLYHAAYIPLSRLSTGTNVLTVEVHQASADSPDLRFDLELLANFRAVPPAARLLQPTPGEVLGTSRIPLAAEVNGGDSAVTWVEFLANGSVLGFLPQPALPVASLAWTNAAPGRYAVQAVAMNEHGLSATSAPVVIDVLPALIPRGAVWKYLDDGSDLTGSPWATPDFDDSTWVSGPAQLGFGEGDEATLVRSGPPGASFLTTYFRHAFTSPHPASLTNLVLRVLRDDGVVAHLNGVEVYRNNMPQGPITALTPSVQAVDDPTFHAARLPPGLLVAGRNVLAVEVHQSGPGSSDLSLDVELLPDVVPQAPRLAMRSPSDGASFLGPLTVGADIATWDPDDAVVAVALYAGGTRLGTAAPDAEGVARPSAPLAPGRHVLHAVAMDAGGLSATSAPVTIEVVAAPILTTLVATGSVWRYLDTATGPGPGWQAADFDEAGWGSGRGVLGFGGLGAANALPATLINGGPAGNRHLTAYFRHHFTATHVGAVTSLAFRVVRDDGMVAYLNGTEVFRMNMPAGPVTSATPANVNVAGTNELFYAPIQIPAPSGLLREGDNVLAVELHQDNLNTSDAAFDLSLVSVAAPQPPPPALQLSVSLAPPNLVLSWTGGPAVLQQASQPQGPYADLPGGNPRLLPATNGPAFFRLRQGP